MPSCGEQKANASQEKGKTVTKRCIWPLWPLLWPFFPAQKVDAEITDCGVEGVNSVKMHLAVLNAGQAHSVQEGGGEIRLACERAEKWLVISHNAYCVEVGALAYFPCAIK